MIRIENNTSSKTANLIHQFRLEQGLSVTEFANRYQVARSTVYCWENGSKIPKKEVATKLCNDMKIPIDELLDIKNGEIINVGSQKVSTGHRSVKVNGVYFKTLASACREYNVNEYMIKNLANSYNCSLSKAFNLYNAGIRASRGPRPSFEYQQDNLIFDLRNELEDTREEFAQRFNVSLSTVSRWETKRAIPKPEIIKKMAALKNMDEMAFYLKVTK